MAAMNASRTQLNSTEKTKVVKLKRSEVEESKVVVGDTQSLAMLV